jgi:hypothetical protein
MKKMMLALPVFAIIFAILLGTSFDAKSQKPIDVPKNDGVWVYWTINGHTSKSCGGTGTECAK